MDVAAVRLFVMTVAGWWADRPTTRLAVTYGYDNANWLTSLTYTLGVDTLGNLTYTYDAAGNRTSVG
jgi:YD repeat-containing protein